jgi:hypothetical protein
MPIKTKTERDILPYDFRESKQFKDFREQVIAFIKQTGNVKYTQLREVFVKNCDNPHVGTWLSEALATKPIDKDESKLATVFTVDADYKCVVFKWTPHQWNRGLAPKSDEMIRPEWQNF